MPDEDARVDATRGIDSPAAVATEGPAPKVLESETPNPTQPVCVADWAMLYGGE